MQYNTVHHTLALRHALEIFIVKTEQTASEANGRLCYFCNHDLMMMQEEKPEINPLLRHTSHVLNKFLINPSHSRIPLWLVSVK